LTDYVVSVIEHLTFCILSILPILSRGGVSAGLLPAITTWNYKLQGDRIDGIAGLTWSVAWIA